MLWSAVHMLTMLVIMHTMPAETDECASECQKLQTESVARPTRVWTLR